MHVNKHDVTLWLSGEAYHPSTNQTYASTFSRKYYSVIVPCVETQTPGEVELYLQT
jgi:hypothetical protein